MPATIVDPLKKANNFFKSLPPLHLKLTKKIKEKNKMKQNIYFSFFIFLFSPKKTFASKLTIRDFAILAQLLSFSFYLLSCSTPTENNKVTFSGTVTLEDTSDFSGVTVSLYAPVELDTALTNLNAQYPGVGIEINQRTE